MAVSVTGAGEGDAAKCYYFTRFYAGCSLFSGIEAIACA